MIFTLNEFIDVIIMTLAVGYIFMDLFKAHTLGFDKNVFWFSCLVTAPAIIIHELAHKFTAVGFGIDATFHAAYIWLAIGVLLKLMRFGFIFFVPAYVSISAQATPLASSLIAVAGPFLNLVLFVTAWALLKQKKLKTKTYIFLQVTKQINLLLFILNMMPIPFFDGMKFYTGIWHALGL